jgi:hypothetical protein
MVNSRALVQNECRTNDRLLHLRSGEDSAYADRTVHAAVPQAQIDDLHRRIDMTRWAEQETVDDWSQGTPLAALRELVRYWRGVRLAPVRGWLNATGQFIARIDGLPIHFLHVRSRHENATPLVLTHGWPGSILEFRNCIAALTDPEAHGGTADDAFHLVIPRCRASAFRASRRRPAGVSKGSGGPGAN